MRAQLDIMSRACSLMVKRGTHNPFSAGSIPAVPTIMRIDSEHPFLDYVVYLNHHEKMDRWQVCMVNSKDGTRRTILYSKYRMSVMLGRILGKEEEVDHKDGDKTNDKDDNLRLLSEDEHKAKTIASRGRNVISLICPTCGDFFLRERRQTHLVKGGDRTFCTSQCAYDFMVKG